MVAEVLTDAPIATAHPLDPLSRDEITRASALATAHAGGQTTVRFPLVALHEPDKAVVRGYAAGDPIERRAFLVTFDTANGDTHEAVVNLSSDTVESWTPRNDVQPFPLMEEFGRAQRPSRATPSGAPR